MQLAVAVNDSEESKLRRGNKFKWARLIVQDKRVQRFCQRIKLSCIPFAYPRSPPSFRIYFSFRPVLQYTFFFFFLIDRKFHSIFGRKKLRKGRKKGGKKKRIGCLNGLNDNSGYPIYNNLRRMMMAGISGIRVHRRGILIAKKRFVPPGRRRSPVHPRGSMMENRFLPPSRPEGIQIGLTRQAKQLMRASLLHASSAAASLTAISYTACLTYDVSISGASKRRTLPAPLLLLR